VSERETGKIVTVSTRGFAFLESQWPDAPNIFVHLKEFRKSQLAEPKVGDRFSYVVTIGDRGPVATELEAA
jgi:cold shock CspA family protein